MSTETKEQVTPAPTEGSQTPVEAKTKTEVKPKVESKAEAESKQQTPAAEAKPEGDKATPRKALLKDGDEIPEDADLIELSPSSLKKRLQRSTDKELKERFGTSDVAQIKKDLDELTTLRKEKDEKRRADMDEKARSDEDKKKAEDRADAAEARLREIQGEREIEGQDTHLRDLASDSIKAKHWKHVRRDLSEHLRDSYSFKELGDLGKDQAKLDKTVKKWLGDYLKENPEFAKDRAEPRKEPLDNGAKDPDRPVNGKVASNAATGGKTMKPGMPNSMTPAEARAEMAKQGIRY